MSNKLGNKIKEIRLEQGMSQEEFAKELGYTSKSTINKIEKGVNDISYDKLELLIQKFDLELNELFDNLAKDMGTKVISEDRTERVDEDYLDAKDIINKAEDANLIDDILFAVYGIHKETYYDCAIIAPSWYPEKIFGDEDNIILLKKASYNSSYEIYTDNLKIAYIQCGSET